MAKGKLYEAIGLDTRDEEWYTPSILEALLEAKRSLCSLKSLDELDAWVEEWFGDEENL